MENYLWRSIKAPGALHSLISDRQRVAADIGELGCN